MLFSEACLYLIPVFLLVICIYSCVKPSNFPPGPVWLPFLGCLHILRNLHKKCNYTYLVFEQLTSNYGPIVGLKLGKQQLVVISTYDLVKKALYMKELDGRPEGFFFKLRSFGKRKGVLFTDGQKWIQHRQFTMKHLKSFGFGQNLMREKLAEEAQELALHIKSQMNEQNQVVVSMETLFDLPVLNVLWTMFAGHRFNYDDEKVLRILSASHRAFRIMDCMGGIISHLPFLRFICPKWSGYNDIMDIIKKLVHFLDDEISEHEQNLSTGPPRDLIEAFLIEMQAENQKDISIFDREELLMLCMDLFMAGSETTSNTLANMFLFLGLNKEWLKKLQAHLDAIIGRNRAPQIDDLSRLPLIEAFIAECQRYIPLAPLGVPHKATEDVWLEGYRIPKGTTTIFSYHSVFNDKQCWDNCEEFNPHRFMSNGNFKPVNCSIPFGLGRRRCLGEILARGSLFIFLATTIHYFDLEIFQENGKPSTNGFDGFVITPKPFKLVYHLRPDVSL